MNNLWRKQITNNTPETFLTNKNWYSGKPARAYIKFKRKHYFTWIKHENTFSFFKRE